MNTLRATLPVLVLLGLTGCWNGGNAHVNLGDVSLGTQLLDLQKALESGAITQQEFQETKATLLALNSVCENTQQEDSSWWF